MKNNVHQNYTRWSIRRLSVGVASVVVASGFFILTSPVQSVLANEAAATSVSQTKPEKAQKDKQEEVNQLINKAVDTALTAPKETTAQSSNNKPATENKVDAANTPKEVSENRAATPAETTPVTSPQQVKDSVANNIKPNTEVPASYLEKANVPGPFLAGVNQVIPYEAFGGDGMLTRLLLKSSENAPWSDNGTAKNPALLPLEGLTKGQYFYEVDLNGNTTGKEGQALLDQLRANGTQTYQATVKVYGNKDGKADLSNVVATKNISITLNGLTPAKNVNESVANNIKAQTEVPASYLEKANVPGPFLAGVNQVIPYEAFGGDGMLTRLLLKSSENAPWSDNGTAKNPALLPLEDLTKGQYFYEVDLNGNTTGKEGQALLDQLRKNGTQTYQATVKVYGNKDGKADLSNVVATKNISVTLNGLTPAQKVNESVANNIKAQTEVPASYLEKANVPGPFLAGVNQVIPYEFFGGDGMLTRLLLKSSKNAPWSDNGTAKNPALLPLEGLTKGQYFYEVDLNGNTTGKEGQALLDQLRANGTQTYQATVKVYGNKDGKADLSNVIATREVRITLHKESMATNHSSSTTNTTSTMKEEHATKNEMKPTTMEHSQQMNSKTMEQETAKKEELSTPMMKQQKEEAKEMKKNDSMKKENKATLPVTGETTTNTSALGAFSAGLAFVLGILGLKAKTERI
ncbi:SSURE domain-containing protein [uncultured Granulicatella sp.]|uniref:fibronectin-binding SSURE repeat-containing protein n=1 Tax=uncultured Granulicatella sp. TaxID=316089 RepID=UPI0028D355B1|nr:fibronectin-binding SSURE repeat-containing protein [uncultured Granulicatella sp.]